MKNILYLFTILCVLSCKTEPKDYVTFSGKITNKNSDSLLIRSRTYTKTIPVSEDGTFNDTLKLETGIYNIFDGKESSLVFLKNGFDLNLTLNTNEFDETIKYTGFGAEHSNFLAQNNLLNEKLLDVDAMSNLDMAGMKEELKHIEKKLTEFYNSDDKIDTSITKELKNQLKPMLLSYERYLGPNIALKTALPKGSPSPSFTDYETFKGEKMSLSDLKGKYTYIDVWATWCGPCKVEFPHLRKLEKAYHDKNIQFVSISIDDGRGYRGNDQQESADLAKQGWKKMITKEALGGVQLLAPNGWKSQFVQDYKINGIPRFILLDPSGNIVDANAPRPSSPKLIDLFKTLEI
ncbi:TlpA disulfide reductase family protein [Flavobacteriaceae bacterium MHTCC 0001]